MASGRVEEYLSLSTCNRSELYMVLPDSDDGGGVVGLLSPEGARVMFDYDAVRHLLRVLLGLESMAKGESHVVSQVRKSYAEARHCGKVLNRLFQRAVGMASTLRSCYHPGREPSIPFLAAGYFAKKNASGETRFKCDGLRMLVVGLGALGQEMVSVLLAMGFDVYVANRSERELDKNAARCTVVPWDRWKSRAASCDAVFLCTGAEAPILSDDEMACMPGVPVIDLGSPHQSAPRSVGARVTLDELNAVASDLLLEYNELLVTLEDEAEKASGALLAEISVLTDETWKHLALARAQALVHERAGTYSGKLGVAGEDLEAFGLSIIRAFLHPLVSSTPAHSARTWRILSGEGDD
jgi:glutamyl-tRNA reductase